MSFYSGREFWARLLSIVVISIMVAIIMTAVGWWFAQGRGRRDTPQRA